MQVLFVGGTGLIGDKANSVVFDNRKIKRWVPDFAATVPWSEGVRRAIAWHEADPSRCTIDDEANRMWDTIIATYERVLPKEGTNPRDQTRL